jgi:hypothetical protein
MKYYLIAMLLTLLVSGCGGSGGDKPDPPSAQQKAAVWDEFNWDEANWL